MAGGVSDQGICLRVWDWSETSQTTLLLTREHGLIRALAKGSKRPRSTFSGGLEPLTRADLTVILKPGAELATLTSWDLTEVFPAVRRSLRAFYAGAYFAELVPIGLSDRDPHPRVFDALLSSLRMLGTQPDDAGAILALQWVLLSEAGYQIDVERDVASGRALQPALTLAFVPSLGGFTDDPPPQTGPTAGAAYWRVRRETVAALRDARAVGGTAEPSQVRKSAAGDHRLAQERAVRLLDQYAGLVFGRATTTLGVALGGAGATPENAG